MTDRILALHAGIREVLILEDRSGHLVVTEEATKGQAAILTTSLDQMTINGIVAPELILGAAEQFLKNKASLRIAGLLYAEAGILFAHMDENRLLAVSTVPESLSEAMQTLSAALPDLIKELGFGSKASGAVRSVEKAGEIARTYVSVATKASQVLINEIQYRAATSSWEVQGSFRSSLFSPSRKFEVELDGNEGAVMSFKSSPSSSSLLFIVEMLVVLAALGLVGWLIYANLLAR